VPNLKYQFGLQDLLLVSTAFAITFALLIAAISRQSTFFLFCAALMFGLSCGGSLGFVFGGRAGIPIGALIGGGIMFILYVASVQTVG